MKVTGPKIDIWLVKTVSVLVLAVGAVLILAGYSKSINLPLSLLALGSALGLAIIDVTYVLRRVISRIYLLDALLEIAFAVLWAWLLVQAATFAQI